MARASSLPACLAILCTLGTSLPGRSQQAAPDGWSDQSYYLAMRDGVRIAVSLYFPSHTPPTQPAPVILFQTRYGRATHFAGKAEGDPQRWRDSGYVVAVIDTRGSTASFGTRRVEIGADEVADMDEIIAHLASRPWANGQVIAAGVSYMADTADWATSRHAPALIAAIPRETDFDAWAHLFFPGGVLNDYMMNRWGSYTREIDLGRDGREEGLDCALRPADCPRLFPAFQPVDDDANFVQVRKAIADRQHWGPDDYAQTQFRDEEGRNGYTLLASSSGSAIADIRRERKPVQYWGSWVDGGTAESALARFRSGPELPMEVWITANNHGHTIGADPLLPAAKQPTPSAEEQFALNRTFVERVRRGETIKRVIHYYVMGSGVFKETDVWPPAGTAREFLAFGSKRSLARSPTQRTGKDTYPVDFAATTGKATRWSTQFGIPPAYPDRKDEDRKLLTYDSMPFAKDTELAGTPVVTLQIAASTADPVVFVYLEDVAPDGRVSYLTEGQLRLIHRKPAGAAKLPYDQGPAPHSFNRADALPVTPGEVMSVSFALFPTAALVRSGHSLRVAISGADGDTFHRYSEGKPEVFTIHYGGTFVSGVEIETRASAFSAALSTLPIGNSGSASRSTKRLGIL